MWALLEAHSDAMSVEKCVGMIGQQIRTHIKCMDPESDDYGRGKLMYNHLTSHSLYIRKCDDKECRVGHRACPWYRGVGHNRVPLVLLCAVFIEIEGYTFEVIIQYIYGDKKWNLPCEMKVGTSSATYSSVTSDVNHKLHRASLYSNLPFSRPLLAISFYFFSVSVNVCIHLGF